MPRSEPGVTFVVEYEDGSKVHINIDRFTLRSGDHVARLIAGERQRAGLIPEGEIKSVKRDHRY
jgi:hypothetical protein